MDCYIIHIRNQEPFEMKIDSDILDIAEGMVDLVLVVCVRKFYGVIYHRPVWERDGREVFQDDKHIGYHKRYVVQ